jgi:hypothetical protein
MVLAAHAATFPCSNTFPAAFHITCAFGVLHHPRMLPGAAEHIVCGVVQNAHWRMVRRAVAPAFTLANMK